ncbi:DUF6376 family protein [Paenibacillus aquistagni]|uniref:DUF6376 family protein n=1 Tax=Paenibacillus aquistagni TaxID=1852522 RepID=UPI000B50C1B4|nr:DUF6376 family protein [Paenibacillus aquistagni]
MKSRLLALMLLLGLLTGCSMLDSVNQSLSYATEATNYVNDVSDFAEQLPIMAEEAITNPAALEQVTNSLQQMKDTIQQFSGLEPPTFAGDIHNQLSEYNAAFLQEINTYLEQLTNQTIDLEAIKQSEMFHTMSSITELMQQIEQLGQ